MPKDLKNEDDVQNSIDSLQGDTTSSILKIPEGKTPIYILSADYSDGYVHWLKSADGRDVRVVCGGGVEGSGFAPSNCLPCQYVVDTYREAKKLEASGDKKDAKATRDSANSARARYAAEFIIAKGELIYEKIKGKKRPVPDFEDAEVGILSLTQKQYQDFINLRGSEKYPFIKSGKDLLNRVIILDKQKRDGSIYPTTEFIPAKSQSDPPDVEWDEEEFDLDADFQIDEEQLKKAYDALSGVVEDDDDDLEFEEDDGGEDDSFDDFDDDFVDDDFDDAPEGFDEVEETPKKTKKTQRAGGKRRKK